MKCVAHNTLFPLISSFPFVLITHPIIHFRWIGIYIILFLVFLFHSFLLFSSFFFCMQGFYYFQHDGLKEDFLVLLDLPSLFITPLTQACGLSCLFNQPQIKRIISSGLRKVMCFSSFFQRKVRLKGCSKEVHTLTRQATKEVCFKFFHTLQICQRSYHEITPLSQPNQ